MEVKAACLRGRGIEAKGPPALTFFTTLPQAKSTMKALLALVGLVAGVAGQCPAFFAENDACTCSAFTDGAVIECTGNEVSSPLLPLCFESKGLALGPRHDRAPQGLSHARPRAHHPEGQHCRGSRFLRRGIVERGREEPGCRSAREPSATFKSRISSWTTTRLPASTRTPSAVRTFLQSAPTPQMNSKEIPV